MPNQNRSSVNYFIQTEHNFALFVVIGSPTLAKLKDAVFDFIFEDEFETNIPVLLDLRDATLENLSLIEQYSFLLFAKNNLPDTPKFALLACQRNSPVISNLLEASIYDERSRIFYTLHQARYWLSGEEPPQEKEKLAIST